MLPYQRYHKTPRPPGGITSFSTWLTIKTRYRSSIAICSLCDCLLFVTSTVIAALNKGLRDVQVSPLNFKTCGWLDYSYQTKASVSTFALYLNIVYTNWIHVYLCRLAIFKGGIPSTKDHFIELAATPYREYHQTQHLQVLPWSVSN